MNLPEIQAHLQDQRIDAWLVYDFRGSNQVFARLFPADKKRHLTRRLFLIVPARGEPRLLLSPLDAPGLRDINLPKQLFGGWAELQAALSQHLRPGWRVAMEYVPGGALPVMSVVDAGTVELIRAMGLEVVSSANLVQATIARWDDAVLADHLKVSATVDAIKDAAFALIGREVAAGRAPTERDIQQFILDRFAAEGLETPDPPIVGVNAHAGDPHFEVQAQGSSPIRPGDWVLIDLWARTPGDQHIYADITWVGFVGRAADVPAKHREIFNVVRAARDAAVDLAQSAHEKGERLQGWQLDAAARSPVLAAGLERFLKHRTGHSLSPGPLVHGMGVNLDAIETRDTREIMPGLGWTVEPGLYLPDFGVRLEINMFYHPHKGPIITSGRQIDIITTA
jgi:Xaa-Pro aminopeptidase